ncbi:hypothetical protein S4054249_07700 [Pseudoalteromonas luteoviolacea]|uniref:Uncharacterized protein n=1 Tax=Pseudoalteromonas luteoviolacea S4054 TaxID=1129367 RepID=A0A0F6A657_9GAMM|nr:hypothetical protein S4054249_07700 [Pseudoalteromonas luteoviolacea]AOT12648.1 hypothetical protein S40542_07700 [Pseudoalteromonas luteoviolacea]KKE81603.1 hypothetical protein N479_22155 [Pseudoalteromonas luteoviolacea S4054]KZN78861.1 hypothetical protein N481_00030 [Pseudoalteromonas luteoviolacea S4047-1]
MISFFMFNYFSDIERNNTIIHDEECMTIITENHALFPVVIQGLDLPLHTNAKPKMLIKTI